MFFGVFHCAGVRFAFVEFNGFGGDVSMRRSASFNLSKTCQSVNSEENKKESCHNSKVLSTSHTQNSSLKKVLENINHIFS